MQENRTTLSYARESPRINAKWVVLSTIIGCAILLSLAGIWIPDGPVYPFDGPERRDCGYFNYLTIIKPFGTPSHPFPAPIWEIHYGKLILSIVLTIADLSILAWCVGKIFRRSSEIAE